MKESEARTLVEHLLVALTRYRGMAREQLGPELLAVAEQVEQWTLGPKCPIPACETMLAQKPMEPLAFFNLMYLAHNMAPELAVAVSVLRQVTLPAPDTRWLTGWQAEAA